ncbi:hypothetical protein TELCIR_14341 [Teladorsagia circumcincta]|uniref:Uncharacterized protein n=1 Tax=Teladorsagia circumcincta TaxID=45464 RepID=A0A2G9U193_TELCI|nr:hypothetical protein TELCIR_14341 [Teladorsagia circumcincta]
MLYVLVLRRRARHAPTQVREIELQEKPLVLLLSPDDCAEHSAVILALSRVLEKHAEVTVLLDHHEMSNTVPSNFPRLTALIHSIDGVYDHRIPSNCTTLDEFNRAVEAMITLMQKDPTWMEQRICAEDTNMESSVDVVEIPEGDVVRLKTDHEREKAAEMFGLLPPEENEMVADDSAEFALLPPDED